MAVAEVITVSRPRSSPQEIVPYSIPRIADRISATCIALTIVPAGSDGSV